MRIISWNVNGIRAIEKKGFTDWLAKTSPDILCLNETKAEPGQLSAGLLNPAGYSTFWASAKKRGYSGVAIYSKKQPQNIRFLGNPEFDNEGRVLAADYCINGINFTVIAAYFPNSQDEGKRLGYKLAFCGEILNLCNTLVKNGSHFILSGDYNIAHTPIDLARPKANEKSAGYLPEERAWMDKFIKAGHIDTFRHFHPNEPEHYTWWSYMGQARAKNIGWRIDYHCVDKGFLPSVKSSIIRPEITGSDHCPVEIELNIV
ncbi:MAG: exodeoxyribonuclease III [Treponema sp.]|jgi:exodeoxyribonuclease-3|nr:exodeoxyribonuclease III [Treponema sp.]